MILREKEKQSPHKLKMLCLLSAALALFSSQKLLGIEIMFD